jgi:hypothetical protein
MGRVTPYCKDQERFEWRIKYTAQSLKRIFTSGRAIYIKQFFFQLKLSERRADTFLSEQSAYPSSVKDYFSRGSQSTIDDSHPSGSLCFLVLVVAKIELFRPRFGEVKPD